MHSLRRVRVGI